MIAIPFETAGVGGVDDFEGGMKAKVLNSSLPFFALPQPGEYLLTRFEGARINPYAMPEKEASEGKQLRKGQKIVR